MDYSQIGPNDSANNIAESDCNEQLDISFNENEKANIFHIAGSCANHVIEKQGKILCQSCKDVLFTIRDEERKGQFLRIV